MALVVGDLLTDPDAQSFISLADAVDYLQAEGAGAGPETPLGAWLAAGDDVRESSLVRASRWLASSFRFKPLTDAGMLQVGRVAARLAAESMGKSLFEGTDTTSIVQSERVDVIAVTYAASSTRADAAGMAWPWLRPMLDGLVLSRGSMPVIRV